MFGHGHSHHGGQQPEPAQRTVRILCKAGGEDFSLAIRYGQVVLATHDPQDPYQHWIKNTSYGAHVKDKDGFPGFALINVVTGEAVKHSFGQSHPVRLVPFNPEYLDESILWTESNDVGGGFRCIRMVNNTELIFDAFHGDKDHGGVRDGTTVVLWEKGKGDNQRWKIVPQTLANVDPRPVQRTVKVFTKAEKNYSLTIRNGQVVLAPNDPLDTCQHWIKDFRFSNRVKDQEEAPAFALVNKATGEAIKHSIGQSHPVQLIRYNPDYLDESVLWTESSDFGGGFRGIRMVNNTNLAFDAFHGDKKHGGVRDGTTVVLWEMCKGDNQLWKIVPQCKLLSHLFFRLFNIRS